MFLPARKRWGVPYRAAEAKENPRQKFDFFWENPIFSNVLGFKTGIFADDELANIFQLFDLKRDGFISKAQCKEALKSLGSSEFHMTEVEEAKIPEKVDCRAFLQLCEGILGIKSKSKWF